MDFGKRGIVIIRLDIRDPNIKENFLRILELKKWGYTDKELQELYNRQIEKDKAAAQEKRCRGMTEQKYKEMKAAVKASGIPLDMQKELQSLIDEKIKQEERWKKLSPMRRGSCTGATESEEE